MSDDLENGLSQNHNGDIHTLKAEGAAVPKHLAGRKQSSSKKFKIESVAAQDDPLYNSGSADGGGGASRSPSHSQREKQLKDVVIEEDGNAENNVSLSSVVRRTEPEGSGGEAVFHSLENLSAKNRTSSNLSGNEQDQKFYSVDDLSRDAIELKVPQNSATDEIELQNYPHPPPVSPDSSHKDSTPTPGADGVAKPGPISYHTKRMGNSQLKFDDSFRKRATVQTRVDSLDNPDPEAVTDIFIPVPSACPSHENTLHETITSAYETNLSINKLLRERHKGSLAAMGRIFGSKQKEAEKKAATSLMPVTIVTPKKKKRKCHYLRPIHVCLSSTFLLIIIATVTTLVMMELSRDSESALSGYHFDYTKRELVIYQSSTSQPSFKGYLGVNIPPGVPFNCTHEYDSDTTRGKSCYKFYNTSTLHLSKNVVNTTGLCINVEWNTNVSDPMLEDCFDLSDQYGYWYGGPNIRDKTFPLGDKDIEFSTYLPGKVFGNMVERFWISTNGIAVVAKHDFPLHIRVVSRERLCLSSWYGYEAGLRTLSYSVCRDTSHINVHRIIMENFYHSYAAKFEHLNILSAPVFSTSKDATDVESKIKSLDIQLNYSYIIDAEHRDVSPYSPLSNSSYPDLSSNMWIQSTDMDVPRLFNIDGKPYTLLNASYMNLPSALLDNSSGLVTVTDLAIGDIRGQEYYGVSQIRDVFQPYIRNFVSALLSGQGPIMSKMVADLQDTSTIVYLDSSSDLGEKVRQILHSSLMGYNLINAGEISDALSEEEFIRTIQLYMFLPVIQFSDSVLSKYNSTLVMNAWKKCIQGRKDFKIVEIITEYLKSNQTRPLYTANWWHDIEFGETQYRLSDQFIFNNEYLVVPIINATSLVRTVYFPHGLWFRRAVGKQYLTSDKGLHRGPKVADIVTEMDEMLVFEYEPILLGTGW